MIHRFELVRRLFLHIEEHSRDAWIDLWIPGFEEEAVNDCVRLLVRLDHLETVSVWVGDREYWKSIRPTASGARLLAVARSEASWSQGKSDAADLAAFLDSLIPLVQAAR